MGSGKKKIEIKKIEKESNRIVTFTKRRQGLFKKDEEFKSMTGAKVVSIVISAAGNPYSYGDNDIDAVIDVLNSGGGCSSSSYNNGSNFGVSNDDDNNKLRVKQLLDEVTNFEDCQDLEKLLMWKKQLIEAKEMLLKEEADSWIS